MSKTAQPVLWSVLIMALLSVAKSQIIPSSYITIDAQTVSVSGSSATGHCSSVNSTGVTSTCTDPTSSVLFDGVIPTLTGLDGDMWANQLLTLQTTATRPLVLFDFTDSPGYVGLSGRLEVVMFNCPEKGISASTIGVSTSSSPSVNPTPRNIGITSCDSLVRVCTPIATVQPSITLEFVIGTSSDMVYLAEVTFYAASSTSTCPPDTIITTALPDTIIPPTTALEVPQTVSLTTPVPDSTSPEVSTTPTGGDVTILVPQCDVCPSCSSSNTLASVITAIVTALLATVIFVLMQIAVCKCACSPKFRPGGAKTGTSAGGEGQVYEKMDGGEGGVAVSYSTYVEVGAGGGAGGGGKRNTFQLKEN